MSDAEKPRTCVVVSYWNGRPPRDLHELLRQMCIYNAGAPFGLVIVCNGGDQTPLIMPDRFHALNPRILNRENRGYNLGAWDWGWRNSDGYEFYLFLQDDCLIKKPNWVLDFEFRMLRDPGIGLLGESLVWDRQTWPFIREATDRDLGHSASSDIDELPLSPHTPWY